MHRGDLIQRLADSENPSIRWKVRVGVLDQDPTSRGIKRLQQEIRCATRCCRIALRISSTASSTRAVAQAYKRPGVPVMQGRYRRCASQQGNALLAATRLGLLDDQAGRLVERLLHWQSPDGGWNCGKKPGADTSSFMETLLPMRGLAAYARHEGDAGALCGGWAADDRYFKPTSKPRLGGDYVNWGSGRKTMNEWITADALSVLHAAGRL